MNKTIHSRLIPLIAMLLVSGCIIGDEFTTITVRPDGSADIVVYRSNVRSSDTGDQADKEVAEYKAKFEAREDDHSARIRQAGGTIVKASWIRQEPPLSSYVHAQLPNAAALEKFWTIDGDENMRLTTQFRSEGSRRRLTLNIAASPDKISPADSSTADVQRLRQEYANGIVETRFAVTNGSISKARGFTVAEDRQSALLHVSEIAELLRAGREKAELYLEWDVTQ